MKPRIGFVLEQALGHVAYGAGLRQVLSARDDLECVWLEVPFDEGGFGRLPMVGRTWTVRGSFRARRAIGRATAAGPLDALFVHTQTISVLSGDHFSRIPTLLSLDATPRNYDELANSYRAKVHRWGIEEAKLLVHRATMKNVRRFTVWSEWTKRSLVQDYSIPGEKIDVLHPGALITNFRAPGPTEARAPGPLRVLFVGGDFVRKGGDLLVDVYRKHLRGICELHLVTGADVEAGEGIHVYRGVRPHSEVLHRLYASADVFVLPTRGDCLAMVLGEAMASGLPIVTTGVGAHAEGVSDGDTGFVIDVDDGAALRSRLEELARDPRHVSNDGTACEEAWGGALRHAEECLDDRRDAPRPLRSAAPRAERLVVRGMGTVLVTGAGGFIGRHLVQRLASAGADIIALDNLKRSSKAHFESLRGMGPVRTVEADIRDRDTLALHLSGCDVVFHLAAQSNVIDSSKDCDYCVTTNVVGTYNVVSGAVAAGVPGIVFTSSREVYGEPASLPVAESAPMNPKNAYGASKVAGEAYCRALAGRGASRVQTVRLTNVYGPGDSGRVIPVWLQAALAGDDLLVYGGDQLLDFVWIETVVSAIIQ